MGLAFTVLSVVQGLRGSEWMWWLIAALGFVIVALILDRRQLLARLSLGQRPELMFGATHIDDEQVQVLIKGVHRKLLEGRFPIITIANDPPADAIDPPDAENVTVTLTLVTNQGEPIDEYVARCAGTDEPVFGSSSKQELSEHTLAPNGRAWSFNTVVLLEDEPFVRKWNNQSMRHLSDQIEQESFLVVAAARGRNVQIKETFQITANPLAIRRVAQL